MRRADALRDQLEQDIVTGALRPGERLDEQSLAARFGVSRTPIREALMQLASAGLVELQPRRGAFVASLSLQEVIERFEVMAALEGACGALAARRITEDERLALLEAHEACAQQAPGGDADAYYYLQRALPPRHLRCLPQHLSRRAGPPAARPAQALPPPAAAGAQPGRDLARRAPGDRRRHPGRRQQPGRAAAARPHPDPGRAADRLHRHLQPRPRWRDPGLNRRRCLCLGRRRGCGTGSGCRTTGSSCGRTRRPG